MSARSNVSSPRSARLQKSPKSGKEGFIPAWRMKSIQDMEVIRARKRELGNIMAEYYIAHCEYLDFPDSRRSGNCLCRLRKPEISESFDLTKQVRL